jgi:1,4-dihydroxy-2-naphthoate octaprenyltransferase
VVVISLRLWIGPVRGSFLLLTPACMALGLAVALRGSPPEAAAGLWFDGMLAFIAALAAHVSVNALNEYVDFKSGLDQHTRRTPFSGGSGTLPAHPALAQLALATGLLALGLSCVIGLYFVGRWPRASVELAPLGLVGVALVAGYTPWITRSPWLCLVAPGLGFGPLMVAGTQFALIGRYTTAGWFASAVAFFLVNNLLLLNQFPDVEPDRAVGRKTLPIVIGRPRCVAVLAAQWLLAFAALGLAVLLGQLPVAALAGWLTMPLAYAAWRGARRHADDIPGLLPYMGMNVVVALATPALAAAGIMLAGR